jgi:hypothetical protein
MTKLIAIAKSKEFRKRADDLLQDMKEHNTILKGESLPHGHPEGLLDRGEAIAQHTISIRDMESAIMRQGMVLKNIGNPDPYPESRDPSSTVVAPTADGLKL